MAFTIIATGPPASGARCALERETMVAMKRPESRTTRLGGSKGALSVALSGAQRAGGGGGGERTMRRKPMMPAPVWTADSAKPGPSSDSSSSGR